MTKPMRLTVLVEEAFFGKVFRTLDGMPGIAGVQIISEAHPPAKAAGKKNTVANGATTQCIVLRTLKERGRSLVPDVIAACKAGGKARASAVMMLRDCVKAKKAIRTGKGKTALYAISPTGTKWLADNCTGAH